MPFRFNRLPRGLLGLLDAKISGQNPQLLHEEIRGIVDLMPFYQAETKEYVTGVTGSPLGGGYANFVTGGSLGALVPASEVWLVHEFSINGQAPAAAGQAISANCAILRSPDSGLAMQITHLGKPARIFLDNEIPMDLALRPFVAFPGDNLGVFISRISGYLSALEGAALISRLQV